MSVNVNDLRTVADHSSLRNAANILAALISVFTFPMMPLSVLISLSLGFMVHFGNPKHSKLTRAVEIICFVVAGLELLFMIALIMV